MVPSSVEQMNELILSVTAGLIDECKVEVDKDESLEIRTSDLYKFD